MNRFKYFILLLALSCFTHAKSLKNTTYGTLKVDQVTSIYDGDTFRVNIDSLHPLIGQRIAIRLAGVDTPEIKGKCQKEKQLARLAKQFTVNALRNAHTIELRNVKRGKYFRIVADVFIDNSSLAKLLVDQHLAVRYGGGHKSKNWCK